MVDWFGFMDLGYITVLIITVLGCALGLGVFIWHLTRYKHKFRIKKITGTKTIVIDDKAKEFRDSDGVTWWKLLKHKHVIAVPPADCLDVTERGRHSVEAYYSDESGYQYEKSAEPEKIHLVKNVGLGFTVPIIGKRLVLFNWTVKQSKTADPKKGKYVYIEDKKPSITGTNVLQTKQKVIMVNQLIKAKARKGFNWREHIPLIVGATALVMIIAVIFIFFGNVIEPIDGLVSKLDAYESKRVESERLMRETVSNTQYMLEELRASPEIVQHNITGVPG